MSLDSQTLAGVKNRVGQSQLISELYRIEKEKEAEMRMHNTTKQRFRAKYSKLDRGVDATGVRLYETYTPGFCYRRNGECRIPQASPQGTSVDFEDLRSLLFTNDEVDIEKVLCLHLLTAHRTETLTPPARHHRTLSFLAKEQSPLERLIERSRKKRSEADDSLTKLLPTYVLDVKAKKSGAETMEKDDVVIRDGRLAARVIINDNIVQLVQTVMDALHNTNPEKMNDLLDMSKDPEIIKRVLEKPHIQEFLDTLNGQILVSSCESFHLTQPFKSTPIPLEVDAPLHSLEKLVSDIRKNVLRIPTQTLWKKLYTKSQKNAIEGESADDVIERAKIQSKSKSKDTVSIASKDNRLENEDVSPRTFKNFISKNRHFTSKQKAETVAGTPRSSKMVGSRNTAKNTNANMKRKLPKYMAFLDEDGSKKSQKDEDGSIKQKNEVPVNLKSSLTSERDDSILNSADIFRSLDIDNVATMLSHKVMNAYKRDLRALNENEKASTSGSSVDDVPTQATPNKVSIKQTTCAACVERWKQPLPQPKVPKYRKVTIPKLDDATYNELKGGSVHKLSLIIDAEIKRLATEEKKSLRAGKSRSPSYRMYKNMAKGIMLPSRQSVDTVELDVFDLAKITQEIKEKETQKKLSRFLETKI